MEGATQAPVIDTSLWVRFTLINPIRFYRLDERIGKIAATIIAKRKEEDIIKVLGDPLDAAKIEKINKEVAYIQKAHEIHKSYWEKSNAAGSEG